MTKLVRLDLTGHSCHADAAGPWNAPVTVEELVPGVTEQVLVRPEAVHPDAVRAEDIPTLVLGLLVPVQTNEELARRLDALARALEPVTDPRLRERIGRQLRPVLASVYDDHPLLQETRPMATMLEVFTEARDAERKEARLEGQARTIVRQATQRFGPETAQLLSHLLAGVTDPDRMDGVAEAVIDCGRGGEFLARVEAVLEADRN